MKPAAKPIVKIVAIVAAVLIVASIALPLIINVNNFRPQIESSLGSALGRQVKVGNLSLSIFSGVEVDELSVADDPKFSSTPFLQAKTVKVGVELIPLIFSKQLNVTDILIDHPEVVLLRDDDGVWNFSSLGNQSAQASKPAERTSNAPANVNVTKLDLTAGTITVGSPGGKHKPNTYHNVDVAVRNFSFTRSFPVTVSVALPGGGSLKIDGAAGPVNSVDTSVTPVQVKVTLTKLDLAQSALVDPALGIAGSADFDGTLNSDGHAAKASGTLKGRSLKLSPKGSPASVPVQLVFAADHDLKNQAGNLTQGDVSIGKALAKLTGTYNMHGPTTSIHTTLNGRAMPVDDLEGMLPALGVVLPTGSKLKSGTLSLRVESTGPLDKLVSTGWVTMDNAVLAGFDLGSKLSSISALSGKRTGNDTTIQTLSSDVRNAPDGTRLDKIDVVIPSLGTVTGAGTVSPSNELDFKMVANLAGIGAGLTRVVGAGSGGIPIKVGGTTSNPTFTPDMKGLATGEVKGLVKGGKSLTGGLGGLLGKKK